MPNPSAVLETSLGDSTVELFTDKMPLTAGNFVKLAKNGFYDGLHFHRVIQGFMLQFGCPHSRDPKSRLAGTGDSPDGTIQRRASAEREAVQTNPELFRWRTPARPILRLPVFINTVQNSYLDWFTPGASKHPVFGRVTSGMDVVQKIERVKTDGDDRPVTPVQMKRVRVIESDVWRTPKQWS